MIVDIWRECYPTAWKGHIVPEAMKHPAKFSSKLIRRIYDHLLDEGWLQPDDTVVDPFGGVALGAFDAMRVGARWIGVELEEPFTKLGRANIELWNKQFIGAPRYSGQAQLLNGDSRNLLQVLTQAGVSVSSPPYAEARIGRVSGQEHAGHGDQYGVTPGQLGAMQAADFDAAIASPPYLATRLAGGGGIANEQGMREYYREDGTARNYGDQDAQLGAMKEEGFWTSARQVIDQVYAVLRPGGHAVWVVKDYVKDHQLAYFPERWRELCEAAGFITIHEHRAALVRSTRYTLDGGTKRIEAKSMFRKMTEKHGGPAIDFEIVYCMSKG